MNKWILSRFVFVKADPRLVHSVIKKKNKLIFIYALKKEKSKPGSFIFSSITFIILSSPLFWQVRGVLLTRGNMATSLFFVKIQQVTQLNSHVAFISNPASSLQKIIYSLKQNIVSHYMYIGHATWSPLIIETFFYFVNKTYYLTTATEHVSC